MDNTKTITVETLMWALSTLDPKSKICRNDKIGSFTYVDPDGYSELYCLCTIEKPGDAVKCWAGCA